MSTTLGIAAVTHVLKNLLNNTLTTNDVNTMFGVTTSVSSLPPSLVDKQGATTPPQLNLFLYRVSQNTGWSSHNFPSRDARGDLVHNPPLALNLHYLLTAFGDTELFAEALLGYGMQTLYETPVLERGRIRQALTGGNLPNVLQEVGTSELADQIEMIKISAEPINAEEISKLWTAFQSRYRPCTAYVATVLLIESKKPGRTPLPVREAVLYPFPFKQPVLKEVLSQVTPTDSILANQQVLVGHTLVLRGHSLKRDPVHVLLGEDSIQPSSANVSDTEVKLVLPSTLKAGIIGVQVTHSLEMGNPLQARQMVASNLLSFVLSPKLDNESIAEITDTDSEYDHTVSVDVTPQVHPDQRAVLLLNQKGATKPAAYSFPLLSDFWQSNSGPVTTLNFKVKDLVDGDYDYLVRVQIDGATSPLKTDISGAFIGPTITIPVP